MNISAGEVEKSLLQRDFFLDQMGELDTGGEEELGDLPGVHTAIFEGDPDFAQRVGILPLTVGAAGNQPGLLNGGAAFEGLQGRIGISQGPNPEGQDRLPELQVVGGAAVKEVAFLDNSDPVAEGLELAQDVGGDEDGFALFAELAQDIHHFDTGSGVQAAGRFIQEEEVRVMDEDSGQAQALLHTAAEVSGQVVALLGEADQLEDFLNFFGPMRALHLIAGAKEIEILDDEHILVDAESIGHIADQAANLIALFVNIIAVNAGCARGRPQEKGEYFQGGRFAGAVAADEAENIAPGHLKVQAIEGDQLPVGMREVKRFDGPGGLGGWFTHFLFVPNLILKELRRLFPEAKAEAREAPR